MRILDLTHHVAGPFATLMLAETGADVIKVERPGGDPQRAAGDGFSFDFLNRRKRSATLNLKSRRGRELLLQLAAGADAVVENFRPGDMARLGLSYRSLRRANPRIVLTSISNFGQTGPRRDWLASELVLQAMGGVMDATGSSPESPPMKLAGNQAACLAGLNAATATTAAVLGVQAGARRGEHVDISIQETFAPHWVRHIAWYMYSGRGTRRGGGPQVPMDYPGLLPAADGYVYLLALRAEWLTFTRFLGLESLATDEWLDAERRAARLPELETAFRAGLGKRSREEWVRAGVEHGYTLAPVYSAREVLRNEQYAARGFFQPAEVAGRGDVPAAGLPFTFAGPPLPPNRAPALGEHNVEVFGALAGLDAAALADLARRGVI